MMSIYLKEIRSFLSSLVGYVVIGFFLTVLGLIMWVFPDSSILDNLYAQMDPLFSVAPLVFMFLIPALTMKAYAEEYQSGTIELLYTKPISDLHLVLAKYLAYFSLMLMTLLPTLLYYYSVYHLGSPPGNLDTGAIAGSYIGLICLASIYIAIGLFSSVLTKSQIAAFIIGAFLCFFFTWVFDFVSDLPAFIGSYDDLIERLGINFHYGSISQGIVDSRNVIYFLSMTLLFLVLTYYMIKSKRN